MFSPCHKFRTSTPHSAPLKNMVVLIPFHTQQKLHYLFYYLPYSLSIQVTNVVASHHPGPSHHLCHDVHLYSLFKQNTTFCKYLVSIVWEPLSIVPFLHNYCKKFAMMISIKKKVILVFIALALLLNYSLLDFTLPGLQCYYSVSHHVISLPLMLTWGPGPLLSTVVLRYNTGAFLTKDSELYSHRQA